MDINNKKISITIEKNQMHIMVVDYKIQQRLDRKYVLLTDNLDLEKAFGKQIANEISNLHFKLTKNNKKANDKQTT